MINHRPIFAIKRLMRRVQWAGLAVFLFFLTACLETIDLEVPRDLDAAIVVQGKLVKGTPSIVSVSVSKLFSFTASSIQPIRALQVKLVDENNNVLELVSVGLGLYEAEIPANHNAFSIEVGKAYKLSVLTADGRTIESAFESIFPNPPKGQLDYSIIEKTIVNHLGEFTNRKKLQFTIDAPLVTSESEEKARLLWETQRTFKVTDSPLDPTVEPKTCYVTHKINPNDVNVVDGNTLVDDIIQDHPLYEADLQFWFSQGYYQTIFQESLSPGAFEYWDQVRQSVERSGNMFESPVGKITTNFRNIDDPDDDVFGFFYAVTRDTLRIYVPPEAVGPINPPCPPVGPAPPGGGCPVELCCDCLSEPISTTIRPEWWIE